MEPAQLLGGCAEFLGLCFESRSVLLSVRQPDGGYERRAGYVQARVADAGTDAAAVCADASDLEPDGSGRAVLAGQFVLRDESEYPLPVRGAVQHRHSTRGREGYGPGGSVCR